MLHTYAQQGEVIVLRSTISFQKRKDIALQSRAQHPEITLYSKEKISIDDIREITYEAQKESVLELGDITKLVYIICDDIAEAAQHALLKLFEDVGPTTCILVYTRTHTVFLPTVVSRVIIHHEKENSDIASDTSQHIHTQSIAERYATVKKILEQYEDGDITKQDIISIVSDIQNTDPYKEKHRETYTRALSMLAQPSVSIKYVLEYVVSLV